MNKFYVASAAAVAVVASVYATIDAHAQASFVLDNNFTVFQETVQTIDLSTQSIQRHITFSTAVDPASIDGQIMLFDVTTNTEKAIVAAIHNDDPNTITVTLDGQSYEEGHEYKLLIGSGLKSISKIPLESAIQFNFKTENVAESAEVLTGEATLENNALQVDGAQFAVTQELEQFLSDNSAALQHAELAVQVNNNTVTQIKAISLNKAGTEQQPLLLDASAADLSEATITVNAAHTHIENGTVSEIVVTDNKLANVEVNNMTITKELRVDNNPQARSTNLLIEGTVTLENVVFCEEEEKEEEDIVLAAGSKLITRGINKIPKITMTGSSNIDLNYSSGFVNTLNIEGNTTFANIDGTFGDINITINEKDDLYLMGAIAAETVTVNAARNVEIGTYSPPYYFKNIMKHVNIVSPKSTVTFPSSHLTVHKITRPESRPIEDVLLNVTDALYEAPALEAYALSQTIDGLTYLNVTHDKNDTLYYGTYRFADEFRAPNVGDKIKTGDSAITPFNSAVPVPFYWDNRAYIFNVDENNVVKERVQVQNSYFSDAVNIRVIKEKTGSYKLRVIVSGDVKGSTPKEYLNSLFLATGKVGASIDLSEYTFNDKDGISYFDIEEHDEFIFRPGRTYFYVENIGSHFRDFPWYYELPDLAKYPQDVGNVLYNTAQSDRDFVTRRAHEELKNKLQEYNPYTYVDSSGSTITNNMRSMFKEIPSLHAQYSEKFGSKRYVTLAQIRSAIDEVNKENAATITTYEQLLTELTSLYKQTSTYLYGLNYYSVQLKDNVTDDTLTRFMAKVESSSLPEVDKTYFQKAIEHFQMF